MNVDLTMRPNQVRSIAVQDQLRPTCVSCRLCRPNDLTFGGIWVTLCRLAFLSNVFFSLSFVSGSIVNVELVSPLDQLILFCFCLVMQGIFYLFIFIPVSTLRHIVYKGQEYGDLTWELHNPIILEFFCIMYVKRFPSRHPVLCYGVRGFLIAHRVCCKEKKKK